MIKTELILKLIFLPSQQHFYHDSSSVTAMNLLLQRPAYQLRSPLWSYFYSCNAITTVVLFSCSSSKFVILYLVVVQAILQHTSLNTISRTNPFTIISITEVLLTHFTYWKLLLLPKLIF